MAGSVSSRRLEPIGCAQSRFARPDGWREPDQDGITVVGAVRMAERKNTDFDRPGGYAMPKGATQVHRQAAKAMIDADVRLYGDSAKLYQLVCRCEAVAI